MYLEGGYCILSSIILKLNNIPSQPSKVSHLSKVSQYSQIFIVVIISFISIPFHYFSLSFLDYIYIALPLSTPTTTITSLSFPLLSSPQWNSNYLTPQAMESLLSASPPQPVPANSSQPAVGTAPPTSTMRAVIFRWASGAWGQPYLMAVFPPGSPE